MADVATLWSEVLPEIRRGVTGVGIWTALNTVKPIALEDGVFVVGLPHEDSELAGHLKMPSTKRLIESMLTEKMSQTVSLRVIDGDTASDWDTAKKRDAEARRLQEQAMNKLRAELSSKSNWDSVYEQLSRRFAAVPNKSLPQNRARFFEEAIELVAEARKNQGVYDEMGERNFARCLERVSQYSEVPSTLVATLVLQRAGEL
jgi:hypothetical protein